MIHCLFYTACIKRTRSIKEEKMQLKYGQCFPLQQAPKRSHLKDKDFLL